MPWPSRPAEEDPSWFAERDAWDEYAENAVDAAAAAVAGKESAGVAASLIASHHAASSADHDDRYYTESEANALLAGKSDTSHTHSGVYDPAGTAATVAADHVGDSDPHPQYESAAEVVSRFISHEAASDPHSGYLTRGLLTAKGDLVGRGASSAVRVPVGADGSQLTADAAQASGLRWSTARFLEGTGSPEGVVSAPVGSEYVDASATLGAVRWVKVSGSGTTGWKVAYGDTGWRVLPAGDTITPTDWDASTAYVRRVNGLVMMEGFFKRLTTGAVGTYSGLTIPLWNIPTGWRPGYSGYRAINHIIGGQMTPGRISPSAAVADQVVLQGVYGVTPQANWSINDRAYVCMTWYTDQAWPTVLP